jgi:acetylglutamate kinase
MKRLFIVKIGGNVLDKPEALKKFLQDFASINALKILIHGGGKIATKLGDQLGIESTYVKGRRITDAATIDLVTMVYGGLVNKQVIAKLQQLNCNALGLTGADGNAIKSTKRPVKDIDYGFVGDIKPDDINVPFVHGLLSSGIVPVFAPLTFSDGQILNTNADTIASTLAVALSNLYHVRLIYCFEKRGVLMDINDDNSVITHLSEEKYQELLTQHVLADGILPKLENAFDSIHKGVKEVLIGDANDLITNTGDDTSGTLITL